MRVHHIFLTEQDGSLQEGYFQLIAGPERCSVSCSISDSKRYTTLGQLHDDVHLLPEHLLSCLGLALWDSSDNARAMP